MNSVDDPLGSELASAEELIEDVRNGRMVILVDDEHRENEGDLVIPAQLATPDVINFMATHGRGLICLALAPERVQQLELSPMTRSNGTRHETAFTVSIEAREGVTTGISAADRSRTIQVAIDPTRRRQDLVSPGHVFPLAAREGGVLARAGHTEAAVDLARLAGLNPSGVICEIMDEDGTMSRLPSLLRFARRHGLRVGTIADLIAYRRRNDTLLEHLRTETFNSDNGGAWALHLYANRSEGTDHIALVKGAIGDGSSVLVRMHRLSFLDDALARSGERSGLLAAAMEAIAQEGRGVVVIIRDTHSGAFNELIGNVPSQTDGVIRDYGVGAQILRNLGVREIVLLSNSPSVTLAGLMGYDLKVVGHRGISDRPAQRAAVC